jgi:serine/threonine-protein kinase RsbW
LTVQPQVSFALDRAIPSDVQYIEGIVAEVTAGCADLGYSQRLVRLNVPVALTEALANAIRRGNGEHRDRFVRIRARGDREELVVEVGDEGPGFDLEACTIDPTTPENLEREDGRGLYLMRLLVDHMEQFVDGGNIVRFTVRRA